MHISEPEGVTLAMYWNASLSNTCKNGFGIRYFGLQQGFKERIAIVKQGLPVLVYFSTIILWEAINILQNLQYKPKHLMYSRNNYKNSTSNIEHPMAFSEQLMFWSALINTAVS